MSMDEGMYTEQNMSSMFVLTLIDRDKWYDSEIIHHLHLELSSFGWPTWE